MFFYSQNDIKWAVGSEFITGFTVHLGKLVFRIVSLLIMRLLLCNFLVPILSFAVIKRTVITLSS